MSRRLLLVEELREGDRFVDPESGYVHWTVLAKVTGEPPTFDVTALVVFGDGGRGWRVWARGTELEIERPDENDEGATA